MGKKSEDKKRKLDSKSIARRKAHERKRKLAISKREEKGAVLAQKRSRNLRPYKRELSDAEIISKLQHNMEILKALEAEFEREEEEKRRRNEELNAQGIDSLDEKVKYLSEESEKI